MIMIPTTNDGSSSRSVILNGVVLTFTTYYNESSSLWFMDISDSTDVPMVQGVALVPYVNLLKPYPILRNLLGAVFILEKLAGNHRSFEKLGMSVLLVQGTEDEIPVPV
jgi:hypothetical protein